jgi:hypothetical protein
MDKFKNIWAWFDGKKSVIGAYCFGAAYTGGKLAGIWNIHYSWISPTLDTLNEFGAAFTGVGLLHKGVKAVTSGEG